jgi:hypothetical protein
MAYTYTWMASDLESPLSEIKIGCLFLIPPEKKIKNDKNQSRVGTVRICTVAFLLLIDMINLCIAIIYANYQGACRVALHRYRGFGFGFGSGKSPILLFVPGGEVGIRSRLFRGLYIA